MLTTRQAELLDRLRAVATADNQWPSDFVFRGTSADTEIKMATAIEAATAHELDTYEQLTEEHEERIARREQRRRAWQHDVAPDPSAPRSGPEEMNDARFAEATAAAAYRASPEGRSDRQIELLEKIVELLEKR